MSRLLLAALLLLTLARPASAQAPADVADRAEADFAAGRIAESVAGYDRLVVLMPSVAPMLWQRGIGLYYLGRFDECAAQFAAFFKANPTDVENAVWNFLCVARAQSPERARAAMLRAGPDPRTMRAEIYEMFAGRMTPEDLLAEALVSVDIPRFYAHFYTGLYYEMLGNRVAALEHMTAAAGEEYAAVGGFMNVVAHVDLERLKRSVGPAPAGLPSTP